MSRKNVRRFLIAYDVSDDRRREKVAKLLQHYGQRVQYSVFIADLNPSQHRTMRLDLRDRIRAGDSIIVCDLGPSAPGHPHPGIESLGRALAFLGDGPLIM